MHCHSAASGREDRSFPSTIKSPNSTSGAGGIPSTGPRTVIVARRMLTSKRTATPKPDSIADCMAERLVLLKAVLQGMVTLFSAAVIFWFQLQVPSNVIKGKGACCGATKPRATTHLKGSRQVNIG